MIPWTAAHSWCTLTLIIKQSKARGTFKKQYLKKFLDGHGTMNGWLDVGLQNCFLPQNKKFFVSISAQTKKGNFIGIIFRVQSTVAA
jgi:hypothetical protein